MQVPSAGQAMSGSFCGRISVQLSVFFLLRLILSGQYLVE